MERKIFFFPAWDRTHKDPKQNYGISDVEIRFVVYGEKGATEFQFGTGWFQKHVVNRRLQAMKKDVIYGKEDFLLRSWIAPKPLDVCYYAYEEIHEDDLYWEGGAPRIEIVRPVYYGYKFEMVNRENVPDRLFDDFINKGEDAVWKYLEDYYVEVFGENE